MSEKPVPRFTGACVLDGTIVDVHDQMGHIPQIGQDVDLAMMKHVASALMQFLSRPPHVRVAPNREGKGVASGPIVSEGDAAALFMEYRMLRYVDSTDARLEQVRQQMRAKILEALDAPPYPSPGVGPGMGQG